MLASDGKVMICDSGEPITSQSDNSQPEFQQMFIKIAFRLQGCSLHHGTATLYRLQGKIVLRNVIDTSICSFTRFARSATSLHLQSGACCSCSPIELASCSCCTLIASTSAGAPRCDHIRLSCCCCTPIAPTSAGAP